MKQAKAFLDDVLAMGWDGASLRFRRDDLLRWFGNEGAFATCKREGAGIESIRAFLGGAFAKGHGVRDALAILTSGQEKAPAATEMPTGAGTTGRVMPGHWAQDTAAGQIAQRERRRAELVAEWVRITGERQVAQVAPPPGGEQPKEKGVREAARKLGMTRQTVERSLRCGDTTA